jgi:DNA replication ATP-dependent helicase Dna2
LDPEARVVFLDTDTLEPRALEEAKGSRIVNPAEARLVTQLVDSLIATGVQASEIGVMTHYRSQLSLIRHSLRHIGAGVEMHTADRFQGRDKEVVVLSLVRSNEAGSIGDLLKDWRRINVAFTRAKTKLLVVGSRSTLRSAEREMVARFVGVMENKGWVYSLPPDALESHFFDALNTQGIMSPDKSSPIVKRSSPFKRIAPIAPLKLQRVANSKEKRQLGDMEEFEIPTTSQEVNIHARPPLAVKRAGMGERLVLKNKPITRDILNELTDGRFSY